MSKNSNKKNSLLIQDENGIATFEHNWFSSFHVQFIIFLAGSLCFANSIWAEFAFDDLEAVIRNNDVKGNTRFGQLFVNDFWGNDVSSNLSHKSYRPLTVLTLRWNYWLVGGLYPALFHAINVVLFGIVCLLQSRVYSIVLVHRHSSFIAGLLFAVHPIHAESVAGVVGRADLLCAIFALLAFLFYDRACAKGQDSNSIILLICSMSFVILAVLCKEPGITVLALCCSYDVIMVHKITPQMLIEWLTNKSIKLYELRPVLIRHLILFITGILILVGRWQVMGSETPTFRVVDNPHSFVNGTLLRIINLNYIYSINAWLLVNPWWLCFDWSMGCVPVINSFMDPRVLAVLCLWILLALLVYKCFFYLHLLEVRQLAIGLAWLIVPFLPAMNILFRVGFVVAERNLFLSSAGFVLIISIGITKLNSYSKQFQQVAWYCLCFLLLINVLRTVKRSYEWQTEKTLFESGLQVCPLNAKVHYNVGRIASDLGDQAKALSEYRKAVSLYPDYDQALNNLGNLLKDLGELEEAEKVLIKATNSRTGFAAAHMNLGIVQAELKKHIAAEKNYLTAIKHRPKYPDCFYNLGNLYQDMGRNEEAIAAWWNATRQNATHSFAWNNIVVMLDNMNRMNDIDAIMKEALTYIRHSATLFHSYASALGKAGRYGESEKNFLKALELETNNANLYANLGVLYHRWQKYPEAEKAYLKALQLDARHKYAVDNYLLLQQQWQKGVNKPHTLHVK